MANAKYCRAPSIRNNWLRVETKPNAFANQMFLGYWGCWRNVNKNRNIRWIEATSAQEIPAPDLQRATLSMTNVA